MPFTFYSSSGVKCPNKKNKCLPYIDVKCFKCFFSRCRFNIAWSPTTKLNLVEQKINIITSLTTSHQINDVWWSSWIIENQGSYCSVFCSFVLWFLSLVFFGFLSWQILSSCYLTNNENLILSSKILNKNSVFPYLCSCLHSDMLKIWPLKYNKK